MTDTPAILDRLIHEAGFSRVAAKIGLRADFECEYCGRDLLDSIDAYDTWENDHLIPVSRSGKDELENHVLSCRLCNRAKRAWAPLGEVPTTRLERISAARSYVQRCRAEKAEHLDLVREIVKWKLKGVGDLSIRRGDDP